MRLLQMLGLVAASVAFAPSCCGAQSNAGTLRGILTDSSDAVVPGATLTLTPGANTGTRTATSNADGSWSFAGIPAGDYVRKVELPGFDVTSKPVTGDLKTEGPSKRRSSLSRRPRNRRLRSLEGRVPNSTSTLEIMHRRRPSQVVISTRCRTTPTTWPICWRNSPGRLRASMEVRRFCWMDSPEASSRPRQRLRRYASIRIRFPRNTTGWVSAASRSLPSPGPIRFAVRPACTDSNALFNSRNPYARQQGGLCEPDLHGQYRRSDNEKIFLQPQLSAEHHLITYRS